MECVGGVGLETSAGDVDSVGGEIIGFISGD